MALGNFTSNQGTQTPIIVDTIGGSVMAIQKLDISPLGSDGTIWNGNVGISSGTLNSMPNIPGGTLGSILGVGGTTSVSIIGGTVSVNELSGTINLGTAVLNDGTIDVVKNAGTLQTGGNTIGNIGSLLSGTINTGTVNLGTFVGKDANAVAQTGNPISVSGTDSGGTVRTIKVDSSGLQRIGLDSGTISVLPNLPGGSVVVTVGTIVSVGTIGTIGLGTITGNLGTIGTLGTLSNLGSVTNVGQIYNAGTIQTGANTIGNIGTLITGTILSSGTSTGIGTVTNLGSLTNLGQVYNAGTLQLGTFVGKDANAVAQTGNPISIGGTDSGGTVRTVLVDSAGRLTVNSVAAGTTIGTISVGTINTGTINTGTINIGTIIKQSPAPLAGSFTAAGNITQAGSQFDSAAFDIGGTWVGTVFTEAQIGTSTWFAVPYISSSGAFGTSFTGNGDYFVNSGGVDGVRARITYSSGTLTYNARQSSFESPIISVYGGTIGNIGMLNGGTLNTGTVTVANVTGLFPANAALGDTDANPTTTKIGAALMGFNSSTWERIRTDIGDGATSTGLLNAVGMQYNGSSYDRIRGDTTNGQWANVKAGIINTGTINTGTLVMTAGTLSPIPTIANVTYGTHGTTGVSIFGTLAGGTGSGAGTEIFITSLSLTVPSTGGSQDCSIGWGTNGGTFQAGTGLLVRGNFPAGGGIQKQFYPPVNSGTNAQLCLFQAGAGTVDVAVTYFTAVSSL